MKPTTSLAFTHDQPDCTGILLANLGTPDAPTPAAGIDASIEREQLDDCIEQLEPKRRVLIRTAFFENVTYDVLAVRVDAPLGSVKSWIRRGLQQLKACLER